MSRETLTAAQIIAAAIELLDAEGLDGLNMRSLGKRLDSAATAMYWHVKNKDNLIRLAVDELWSEIELPSRTGDDWRSAATKAAVGMHEMLTRHPWLGQAFGSHLLYGHGKARFDDHCLAIYDEAGFSRDEADRANATVFIFVLGSALGDAVAVSLNRRLSRTGGDPEEQLRETMAKATEIGMGYAHLRARLEAPGEYSAAPDGTFRYGLDTILDGIEARRVRGGLG